MVSKRPHNFSLLLFSLLICDHLLLSSSDDSPPDCPYPCLPSPTSMAGYPPPTGVQPAFGYPPPPPAGFMPNYSPPSLTLPAPPPPNPILPYFPFYYRNPSSAARRSSAFGGATLASLLTVIFLMGILFFD